MNDVKFILSLINHKTDNVLLQRSYNKLVTFLSPYKYLKTRKHLEYIDNFDVICIDGYFLLKLLQLFKIVPSNIRRQSFDFTSLAGDVFEYSIKNDLKLCMIGTHPELIAKAVSNIKERYPTLNIVFFHDGYFQDANDEANTIKTILMHNPDIVICGMGIGKQEQFLLKLRENHWCKFGITCGGFFHQIFEHLEYFPKWANKYNLRWLYRIYKEPENILRYKKFPMFLSLLLYDILCFYYLKIKKNRKRFSTKDIS
jgi:N-acetylglucosaminyldiphosphoundecaprenol N-acetyl-beta-D-mannosaminyltransferase